MRPLKRSIIVTGTIVLSIFSILLVNSCTHAPYVLPVSQRAGDPNICFESDVLPIFVSNCAKSGCHDASSGKSGYTLDNYEHTMRKGIVPGNPAASKIWESVAMKISGVSHMPVRSGDLTASQLDVIKRWIATGAIDSGACSTSLCDTTNFTYSGAIAPMMQLYCVGCHHSASDAGGGLADYNSVKAAVDIGRVIGNITHQAGYNAMPQGGAPLSDCQVTQVKKWIAAGALNN